MIELRKEHAGFWQISATKTRIYYVGESVSRLEHTCTPRPGDTRSLRVEMLRLFKPQWDTFATAYCSTCDMLFVGLDVEPINERVKVHADPEEP